jgi:hypothetical protein
MPWLMGDLTAETGLKMLATLVALFGALYAVLYAVSPALSRYFRVKHAVYVLSTTSVDITKLIHRPYLLPRKPLNDSLLRSLEDPEFNTVLVYGVRGSGKTTAVVKALSAKRGVIEWSMSATDYDSATAEMRQNWDDLFSRWRKSEDRDFDKIVCRAFAAKNEGIPLVVVVSVEAASNPYALESLLRFCKTKSYDYHLVRFIVDVSSSRTALALKTDTSKLRLRNVFVQSLTQQEANLFLSKSLPEAWTKPRIDEISLAITMKTDCILLQLVDVCTGLSEFMSTTEAKASVEDFHEAAKRMAKYHLENFNVSLTEKLSTLQGSPKAPKLIEGTPAKLRQDGLSELIHLLGFSGFTSLVFESGSPYIFNIDPFNGKVSLNGKIMEEAFIEYYR